MLRYGLVLSVFLLAVGLLLFSASSVGRWFYRDSSRSEFFSACMSPEGLYVVGSSGGLPYVVLLDPDSGHVLGSWVIGSNVGALYDCAYVGGRLFVVASGTPDRIYVFDGGDLAEYAQVSVHVDALASCNGYLYYAGRDPYMPGIVFVSGGDPDAPPNTWRRSESRSSVYPTSRDGVARLSCRGDHIVLSFSSCGEGGCVVDLFDYFATPLGAKRSFPSVSLPDLALDLAGYQLGVFVGGSWPVDVCVADSTRLVCFVCDNFCDSIEQNVDLSRAGPVFVGRSVVGIYSERVLFLYDLSSGLDLLGEYVYPGLSYPGLYTDEVVSPAASGSVVFVPSFWFTGANHGVVVAMELPGEPERIPTALGLRIS